MVSTKDRKYEVILDICAVIDAATAVFRLKIIVQSTLLVVALAGKAKGGFGEGD